MTTRRIISIIAIGAALGMLVAVRYFEENLFYDPLNSYFHSDFQNQPIPALNLGFLLFSNLLRYLMNTVLSIAIIWFAYRNKHYVKASFWVYLFSGIILLVLTTVLLYTTGGFFKMALFYLRRFIIHPLLLFILIGGFFYLKTRESKTL
jgi:exosortase F-associated protein